MPPVTRHENPAVRMAVGHNSLFAVWCVQLFCGLVGGGRTPLLLRGRLRRGPPFTIDGNTKRGL